MSLQGYWADLKASDFLDLPDDTIAVLPLGAIEQHGPHLPLSVDRDLSDAVAGRALQELGPTQSVLVLPVLAITTSNEHKGYPGTLSLSPETLLASLRDIGASVARAGIDRLVFFNGHGGNTAVLEIAARELRIAHDLIVATCSWFGFVNTADGEALDSFPYDLHAGEIETSAMLALRPELVEMTRADDFVPVLKEWESRFKFIGLTGQAAKPAWVIEDLHIAGATGNAAEATAAKGQALLRSAAKNFALFLAEFAEFDHRRAGP